MWKQLLSAIQQLFILTEKTEQNKKSIEDLRNDVKVVERKVEKLASAIHILANDNMRMKEEIKNNRESEVRERENLALRLENEMLKFERRLPSGDK